MQMNHVQEYIADWGGHEIMVRATSAPSSVLIRRMDMGDEIIMRDDDGNDRYIFRGLKTYVLINGVEVLWDMEKNKSAEVDCEDITD